MRAQASTSGCLSRAAATRRSKSEWQAATFSSLRWVVCRALTGWRSVRLVSKSTPEVSSTGGESKVPMIRSSSVRGRHASVIACAAAARWSGRSSQTMSSQRTAGWSSHVRTARTASMNSRRRRGCVGSGSLASGARVSESRRVTSAASCTTTCWWRAEGSAATPMTSDSPATPASSAMDGAAPLTMCSPTRLGSRSTPGLAGSIM